MAAQSFDPTEFVVWRPSVETRMRTSAVNGAKSLCVFDQRVAPRCGAPLHTHTVEEVLRVQSGTAKVTIGDKRISLSPDEVLVIPAGLPHGFENVGESDRLCRKFIMMLEAARSSDAIMLRAPQRL